MLKVVHNFARVSVCAVCIVFLAGLFIFSFTFNSTHAANSADIEASVTINPSLTLSIPSNTITMNLDPSTHAFDEKDLTVSVGTNNSTGYTLYLTTTNPSGTITNNLTNVADNSKTIPNLTTSTTTADFPVNKWGYRISDGSTSSGNYGPFNPTTDNIISQSSGPVNNITKTLGFASKIDYTKESGLYQLNLNFKALPIITQYYMQDLTTSSGLARQVCTTDPTVVVDKRDERAYTIRRINGVCWMVENLKFVGTELNSTTSNVSSIYTPNSPLSITYYNLNTESYSGGRCYRDGTNSSGDINPCLYKGSNGYSSGETVWYNYPAASAGSAVVPNNNETQYSLCPANWKLPTYSNLNDISGYTTLFNPTLGGYLNENDNPGNADTAGYWWSSTPYNDNNRWYSRYYKPNDGYGTNHTDYAAGHFVRCILNES